MSKYFMTTKIIQDVRIDNMTQEMKNEWDKEKKNISWWKKVNLNKILKFILHCLDYIIVCLFEYDVPGENKKHTAIAIIDKIISYIIESVFPFWLRPFTKPIKYIILKFVVWSLIDFLVSRYKESWKINAQMFGVPGGHRPKF